MKNNLIVLFALTFFSSFAQNNAGVHYISLSNKKDKVIYAKFYIAKIYDSRRFKDNIGIVQKGVFNKKVVADFATPMEEEVFNYLTMLYPKKAHLEPITIRINDLYISELTRGFSETGYASVALDVLRKKDSLEYVIGTYSSSVESSEMDVTHKHDERIKQVINDCINQFANATDIEKGKIIFDNTIATVPEKNSVEKPAKGIYLSFVDLLKNKPQSDINYTVSKKGDKYYLTDINTNKKVKKFYGFSDGETLFLNVSKYANRKYYVKTERIENNYFIENVVYNPDKAGAIGARAISLIIFPFAVLAFDVYMLAMYISTITATDFIMFHRSDPMLINCYSGKPIFLSNNRIKNMLTQYPELLKEYKKGGKTAIDIKNIMIKYYSLIKG